MQVARVLERTEMCALCFQKLVELTKTQSNNKQAKIHSLTLISRTPACPTVNAPSVIGTTEAVEYCITKLSFQSCRCESIDAKSSAQD